LRERYFELKSSFMIVREGTILKRVAERFVSLALAAVHSWSWL